MKFGIVVFPGSNCDRDMQWALEKDLEKEVRMLWHKDTSLQDLTPKDCIVLPGGFSYGDYLRCGAIASQSPIMKAVKTHAEMGGFVFGVCNGFQILCETHLLPGVLLANNNSQFICKNVFLKAPNNQAILNKNLENKVLKIPIAHGEGRYYADENTINSLKKNNQILFQYCDENGLVTNEANPNGATENIAGICNENRNVFGMMPHPERATNAHLLNNDGLDILKNFITI